MHGIAHRSPPLFVDAVEIPAYLDADRATPYAERLHRDRTIGASLATRDPLRRVRAWRRALQPDRSSEKSQSAQALAERVDRGRRLIGLLTLIIGALTGVAVASAVFHYDGTWPVNVVTALAVLVLLQAALATLTLILMAPRVPGLKALQDLLGALNPGALVAAVYRRAAHLQERRADLLVWPAARGPAVARYARWQMLLWSQVAAIAFNIAVLATAAALIAFTDLAFGWSTTLRVDGDDALRITDALATPWAWFWPAAAPSEALIESSRFFRLASAPSALISAETLTGWWPFLLAAIIAYGLAPRCALLIIALVRLRAATKALLLDDPQVKALLDRMDAAEVALGAADIEAPAESGGVVAKASPAAGAPSAASVLWSGAMAKDALNEWSRRNLRIEPTVIIEAGGGRDLGDDAAAIRELAEAKPRTVLLFVRAWEAPLLDLQDFLASLRTAVGAACSIIVVPVGAAGTPAEESQRATWARWIGRIADPALYMESGA